MKTTMQNWIALASEVNEAVQVDKATSVGNVTISQGKESYLISYEKSFFGVRVFVYNNEQATVSFMDRTDNTTDFDALFTEAEAWWNEFKTSDHEILIDNQIRKTLRHENTTDQF